MSPKNNHSNRDTKNLKKTSVPQITQKTLGCKNMPTQPSHTISIFLVLIYHKLQA